MSADQLEEIRQQPILNDEIIDQNFELMGEKFPAELINEWQTNSVPVLRDILENYLQMSDTDLGQKAHKCAGSVLQIGGNRLGIALRTASHLIRAGSRDAANAILKESNAFFNEFLEKMKNPN